MGEKNLGGCKLILPKGYEYSNFAWGKSITKLEFINLYCKYVFKFTKIFGFNRYKAHKFALILD